MSPRCEQLQSFADGELDPAEVPAFETHLAGCSECRAGFADLMHLATLAEEAAVRQARRYRWRPRVISGLAMAAALVLAVSFSLRLGRTPAAGGDPNLWLAQAPTRLLEPRLSGADADRHRPYDVPRAAGQPALTPPLSALAALEQQGDVRSIAEAYLIRRQPEQALQYLARAGASAEVEVDRSAAALLTGDPLQALRLADHALRAAPAHAQALWNRALALRELGLPLTAAEAFEQVAAKGEQGWSAEAARQAAGLRSDTAGRRATREALEAGCRPLIATGAGLTVEDARRGPGWVRACFYEAVRAAPDPERIATLLPLAAALDEVHREPGTLTAYARRVMARDFTRRRPLASTYLALVTSGLSPAEQAAFLDRLRAAGEDDLLLGALLRRPELAARQVEEIRTLAARTNDAWFELLSEEKQAEAEVDRGAPLRAEERLVRALRRCDEGNPLHSRCEELQRALSYTYLALHRPVEAREHALKVLARARRSGDWPIEKATLLTLGQIARFEGDLSGTTAYLEEALRRTPPGECREIEYIQTNIALAHQKNLDFGEMRRRLDLLAPCSQPASFARITALADLARALPRPEDEQILLNGLAALRSSATLSPGKKALLDHTEARFRIIHDRAQGQSLLRRVLAAAAPLVDSDVHAQKASVYSYTSLLMDAGQHGELESALALFGEELGAPVPDRCLLAAAVDDERTLVIARGRDGRLLGRYDASRSAPLADVTSLVPADMTAALRGCDQVQVLARPPLAGQGGLLPSDLAWAYRLARGPHAPSSLPPRRLIVADTVPPPGLRLSALGRLPAVPPDPATVILRGDHATPARVLEEMARATEVQIHAHGLVDPERSDASYIALSVDSGGEYALSAGELRRARLEGKPVVVLATCHAARTAPYLHESHGLPGAFIHAGARAVLAAASEIPDAEATELFQGVLEAMRNGQPGAVALRDARVAWGRKREATWVDQVLLFE